MSDDQTPPPVKRRGGRKKGIPNLPLATGADVVSIFGKDHAIHPTDPDGLRPQNDWTDVKDEIAAGGRPKRAPRKKVKMGRRWSEVQARIDAGEMTMKEFVETLTPEELARGQMKAINGRFVGAPPRWVPAEFHRACMQELLNRGKQLYQESYLVAIQAFTTIAADGSLEPKDRLKAAQYIWERVEGKVPDKVEVSTAQPWETIIDGIIAETEDDAISRATHVLGGGD